MSIFRNIMVSNIWGGGGNYPDATHWITVGSGSYMGAYYGYDNYSSTMSFGDVNPKYITYPTTGYQIPFLGLRTYFGTSKETMLYLGSAGYVLNGLFITNLLTGITYTFSRYTQQHANCSEMMFTSADVGTKIPLKIFFPQIATEE